MKLGGKVDTSQWTLPTAQFPPNPVQGTQPTTPPTTTPYTPGPSYGGAYYGYGDRDGGGRLYNFLPENIASAAQAGKSNPYELLVDDPSKVVTIGSLLQKYKQPDGKYLLHPGDTYGVGKNDYKREAQYGTREDLLNLLGLNKDTPDDAKIGITDTYVGEGEAFGGDIYTDIYKDPSKQGTVQSRRAPSNIKGYSASAAPELKGFVQIGNLGPLEDDINNVLNQVMNQFGAKTPEQQAAVKQALFKYDPKYGVLANKAVVDAAKLSNTRRDTGFFESGTGAMIAQAVASFINPALGAAVSAMYAGYNGGNIGDIVKSMAASYFGGQVGGQVGSAVGGATGSAAAGQLAGNLAQGATEQLISTGKIDGKGLLGSAAGSLVGGAASNAVGGGLLGQAVGQVAGGATNQLITTGKVNLGQMAPGLAGTAIQGGLRLGRKVG